MADAMKRCGELGMTDRVTFCGSRTDIPEILSESAMLVHASGYEAFGLSVLEAMRAALPVVATNTGALPEVIADGITGILSEHGDTQQFRSAVETLLLDSELRARMGRAGRERYLQEFTVEAMQEKTLRVYKSLIVAGS